MNQETKVRKYQVIFAFSFLLSLPLKLSLTNYTLFHPLNFFGGFDSPNPLNLCFCVYQKKL
jgi:phosphatidylserine synthase